MFSYKKKLVYIQSDEQYNYNEVRLMTIHLCLGVCVARATKRILEIESKEKSSTP